MPYERLTKKVGNHYMYNRAGIAHEGLDRLGEFEDREEQRIKEKEQEKKEEREN